MDRLRQPDREGDLLRHVDDQQVRPAADRIAAWMQQLLAWGKEGKIRPHVDSEVPFAEAPQAHHRLQDRKNVGKVVLVP